MKHFGKVFAAAAMTGAIALAGSPIANAATLTKAIHPSCHTGQGEPVYVVTDPKGNVVDGATGKITGNGNLSTLTLDIPGELLPGEYTYVISNPGGKEVKDGGDCAGSIDSGVTPEPVDEDDDKGDTTIPGSSEDDDKGETTIPGSSGSSEGDDKGDDKGDTTIPGSSGSSEGDDKGEGTKEECDEKIKDDCEGLVPGSSGSSLLLPAILLLGSSTWFLNQDGSTYVSSEDRVTETPTPEEKETSDKVKEENEEAIKEQGGEATAPEAPAQPAPEAAQPAPAAPAKGAPAQTAPAQTAPAATERGVSANTGDNSAAQGLFALAIAAMLGVAAFAVRRNYSA